MPLRADENWRARWDALKAFKGECLDATPESLPGLIRRFSEIPEKDIFFKGEYFVAVADAWLRQRVPPGDLVFAGSSALLPELPPDYPKEYAAAIRRYLDVTAPSRALLKESSPSKETAKSFLGNEKEYWDLATALLENRGGPFADRVLRYVWGHWCGTGSDRFHNPHSLMVLMALIQDGRWQEAAGAALMVQSNATGVGLARLLVALFPHPEEVVAGGLALRALQSSTHEIPQPGISDMLTVMVILPGENRARLLTELAGRAPEKDRKDYYRALKKFVPRYMPPRPPGSPWRFTGWSWSSSGDNLDSIQAEAVGAEGQKLALDFLCSQASPGLPVETAKTLASIFREKQQPQMIPAMRQLLEHPSQSVAEEAAEGLRDAGESFTMPKKLGPIRYRILVNGEPHAGKNVAWRMPHIGSSGTTSPEGILEISRDYFLDAKDITRIALYSSKELAYPPTPDDPAHPWFVAILPTPDGTDEPHTVSIATQSQKILLDLPRPNADLKDREMEITLSRREDPDLQDLNVWGLAKYILPAAREWTLPKVQPGEYRLGISLPGFASWSGHLSVSDAAPTTVTLTKASDVKFAIHPPPDWDVRSILPELWQNGKRVSSDWEYEKRFFRGVLPGDYTLRIPSSVESRKKIMGVIPARTTFRAVDIPFTVPADPPMEILLEDITLSPET